MIAFLNLTCGKPPEATLFAKVLSPSLAIWISTVTFFKLDEVCGREGSVFLSDAGHVGARVENPRVLSGVAFLEEDDICFDALTVRRERTARQTQDRMNVAILHQYLENFARLALEQAVVRKHDCGTAAGFQNCQDVLQEV